MTALRTERLVLEPVTEADSGQLLDLFNSEEVGRFLLDGMPVSFDWVRDEIAASQDGFRREGCGLWAIRRAEAEASSILGVVGFRPFFAPPELQLLYALHPTAWGSGLATEAARAAVDHAFRALGFKEVRAATDEPNLASVAVLERLGMERWKVEEGDPHRTLFYRLARTNWTEGAAAGP